MCLEAEALLAYRSNLLIFSFFAAAMPHLTVDPIVAASAIVTALQHLVSRVTKATEAAVISVSRFNTGKPGLEFVLLA